MVESDMGKKSKRRKIERELFLERRGFSPDGAIYMKVLLKMQQNLRSIEGLLDSAEVYSSTMDLQEYIQNEIDFIRAVEGK